MIDPPDPSVPSDRPISRASDDRGRQRGCQRPPPAWPGCPPHEDQREVVVEGRPARERAGGADDGVHRGANRAVRMGADDLLEPLDAELLVAGIGDFHDAVGVEHQRVAGLERRGAAP